jgi:hypothetical protein
LASEDESANVPSVAVIVPLPYDSAVIALPLPDVVIESEGELIVRLPLASDVTVVAPEPTIL